MGDPRRTRNKHKGPRHPWNKERIDEEKKLVYDYGLTAKKELWKAGSKLKNFKDITKKLIAQRTEQSDKELDQLFTRLHNLGITSQGATAEDVLGLQTSAILDRRLQTLVYKHELAKSPKQARQLITHGHITVNGQKMTSPSYLVPLKEESQLGFRQGSSLSDPEHPERAVQQTKTGAGETNTAQTGKEKQEAPSPVAATEKTKEEEKPVEQQVEEDTDNAGEVAEAVEEAEAGNIAEDHERAVKEAAAEAEKKADEKDKEGAQ